MTHEHDPAGPGAEPAPRQPQPGRQPRGRPRPWGAARPVPEPRTPPEAPAAPAKPGARVAVTAPRRHRTGGYSALARAADLHAQPQLGQVYLRSLVRNQLRLALGVLAVLCAVLGGLPAAFALLPGLRTAEVAGIRLPWLLLGVVAYPLLLGAASFHVHHAERVEGDFTELLAGPDQEPGPQDTAPDADTGAGTDSDDGWAPGDGDGGAG